MPGSVASISAQVRPFGQLLAEAMVPRQVRAAGGDQVAHPGEAGERQRVRAGRDAEPRHLGQTAGQQPGLAVVAEAEPVGGAGRDRDDVLERPAQLDAEDVLVHVQPEPPPGDPRDDPLRERQVRGGDDGRRRQVARDLGREVRAGQRRDPADRHAGGLGDDLAHAQQRSALEALDDRQEVRRRAQERRDRRRRSPAGAPTAPRRATRSVASRSAAGSAVAITPGGRSTPGSRASFRPVSRIRAAVSGEWHSSVTGSTRATTRASVVPHAPAPTTATRGPAISRLRQPACAAALRGAAPLADATGALRSFLRRGSLTEERSRKTSRIGVPSKPNFSRSWFSR